MSLYYMDSETLINTFLKEEPSKLEKAQFVIVSSRIYKSNPDLESAIIANTLLFPSEECLMYYDGARGMLDKKGYRSEYYKQLDENKAFLATLILGVLSYQYTIFFICSKKEMKLGYLKMLSDYIDEKFHYPVYSYKDIKKGTEVPRKYDLEEVYHICDKIVKKQRKKKIKNQCKTTRGRSMYVSEMSKDEMKKLLKKMGLYSPHLTLSEMKEILEEFFVDQ